MIVSHNTDALTNSVLTQLFFLSQAVLELTASVDSCKRSELQPSCHRTSYWRDGRTWATSLVKCMSTRPPVPRPAAADAAVVSLCSILADDQDMFSFQSVSCAALHQAPAGVARGVSAEDPGTRHRAISRRLLAQAPGIQTGIHAGVIGRDGKIGIR